MDRFEIEDAKNSTEDIKSRYKSAYGKPNLKIGHLYIRAALALLVEGASRLQSKKLINALILENPITYLLDEEMKDAQREGTSDIIRWVIQPNIKRDPNNTLLRCIPDIMFLWSNEEIDPDLCICAEAKRLFGTGSTLAGKYVEQGLLDFVEGRYGRSHNYGIMVGYVLVGPLNKAVRAVQTALKKRKAGTSEKLAFTSDNSIIPYPYTYISKHHQFGTNTSDSLTIIHLFLDFS